jgi:hypothetical protein
MKGFKYLKKTKLKLAEGGVLEFNGSDDFDPEYPWKVGTIITVEPDTDETASRFDEEPSCDNTYCIHEHTTHGGWDKDFIENHNNFIPKNFKITNWKKELE